MLDKREKQPEMDRQLDYIKEESSAIAPIQWGSDVDSSNTTGPSITSSSSSSSSSTRISASSIIASTSVGASINISRSAEMVNDDVKPRDITPRHDTITTNTSTTCTNEGQIFLRSGRWTPDEKILFLYGLRMCGKGRWKKMSVYLPQRSLVQIKSHAQKVLKRQQAGENIFRRLDENYGEIDNLVVQAARQRDALRMAGIKVHNPPPTSTKASKCITKKKRLHNQTGTSTETTVALVATQESSFGPASNITTTTFPVNQTPDSSVLAAAALCQLSNIGGNWYKRENKNTNSGGNGQQNTL